MDVMCDLLVFPYTQYPISLWNRIQNSSAQAWQFSRRYSLTVQKLAQVGLNCIFLAGRAASQERLSQVSLAISNSLSVYSLSYFTDYLRKEWQDAQFSCKLALPKMAALSLFNFAQMANDILMTITASVAAGLGLAGHEELQNDIYGGMRSWGYASLACMMGALAINIVVTNRLHNKFQRRDFLWKEQKDICCLLKGKLPEPPLFEGLAVKQGIFAGLQVHTKTLTTVEIQQIAAEIRFCMDKDNLFPLLEKMQECKKYADLFSIVKENIATQMNTNLKPKVALSLIGFIILLIEYRYTVNATITRLLNLLISGCTAYYAVKENWQEYQQRAATQMV